MPVCSDVVGVVLCGKLCGISCHRLLLSDKRRNHYHPVIRPVQCCPPTYNLATNSSLNLKCPPPTNNPVPPTPHNPQNRPTLALFSGLTLHLVFKEQTWEGLLFL